MIPECLATVQLLGKTQIELLSSQVLGKETFLRDASDEASGVCLLLALET